MTIDAETSSVCARVTTGWENFILRFFRAECLAFYARLSDNKVLSFR